ncbi:MAG TPA: four helix bundle protein, partial [Patescibacteria group bacterium]|nr:four helix bundle protein [Patescibacteria group bacterium]
MALPSFKDLIVWQKSFRLVQDIYRKTQELPKSEQFGLISQLQRCAVSIPS